VAATPSLAKSVVGAGSGGTVWVGGSATGPATAGRGNDSSSRSSGGSSPNDGGSGGGGKSGGRGAPTATAAGGPFSNASFCAVVPCSVVEGRDDRGGSTRPVASVRIPCSARACRDASKAATRAASAASLASCASRFASASWKASSFNRSSSSSRARFFSLSSIRLAAQRRPCHNDTATHTNTNTKPADDNPMAKISVYDKVVDGCGVGMGVGADVGGSDGRGVGRGVGK